MFDQQDSDSLSASLASHTTTSAAAAAAAAAAEDRRRSSFLYDDEDEHERDSCVLGTFDVAEQRALLERIERERNGEESSYPSIFCWGGGKESNATTTAHGEESMAQLPRLSHHWASENSGMSMSTTSMSEVAQQRSQSTVGEGSGTTCSASESSSELVREQQAIWEAIQKRQREESEELERLRKQCEEEEKEEAMRRSQNSLSEDSFQLAAEETSQSMRGELRRQETDRLRDSCADETAELLRRQYQEEDEEDTEPPATISRSSLSSSLSSSVRSTRRRDVLRSMKDQGDDLDCCFNSKRGGGSFYDDGCAKEEEDNAAILEVYAGKHIRVIDRRESVLKSDSKKSATCGGCSMKFFVSRGCKILYCPECETLTPTSFAPVGRATAA